MTLQAPQAGERTVLASKYGRCLYEQIFIYPDGHSDSFSLWGYERGVPAIIFPVTADKQVVAVRQFRHGANDFMLEVPGGIPKGSQLSEEVAERELLEETGYKAKQIIGLGVQPWMDAAAHTLRFTPFLGLDCTKVSKPSPGKNEILETVLVPLEEWYKKIWRGEICDNKVIGHSLLVLPFLGIRLQF